MYGEKTKEFRELSNEERDEAVKKAYYENLDKHLDTIFFHRALELSAYPEDEEEIDKYISEKSKELMAKYGKMNKLELLVRAMSNLSQSRGIEELAELVRDC